MSKCINCGIATNRSNNIGRHVLDNESILFVIREWLAPQPVQNSDIVCHSCWNLVNNASVEDSKPKLPPKGHHRVCILCGCSLLRRKRYHELRTCSFREQKIREIISQWILPRTVDALSVICHSCWGKANRACRHFASTSDPLQIFTSTIKTEPGCEEITLFQELPTEREPCVVPTVQTVSTNIILPNYCRVGETESRCFVTGCKGNERNRLTLSLRKQLLRMYNLYVPANNRICDEHSTHTSWDFLHDLKENMIKTFDAYQIQDMLALKE